MTMNDATRPEMRELKISEIGNAALSEMPKRTTRYFYLFLTLATRLKMHLLSSDVPLISKTTRIT